jgi:AcrR family transcriptional regulator
MSTQSKVLEKKFMQGFEESVTDKGVRQILLHAMDVFARKGLVGTRIKDIAARAGFSQGYIYNYFKSKDEIFTRIVELAAEGAGKSVQYAAELNGSPYDKVYWLTEAYLSPDSIAMQHWRLIMLQAITSDAIPEEALQISKEMGKRPIEHLIPVIMAGQQAGQMVKEDPLVLAITYFSIIQGMALTRIQNGKDIPFPTTDLVLSFIRKQN